MSRLPYISVQYSRLYYLFCLSSFCIQCSRNCLPFHSTCVHPHFLVGFVLLDLEFYVFVLQIVVCPFVFFLLAIVLSVLLRYTDANYPFDICKLFLCPRFSMPLACSFLHCSFGFLNVSFVRTRHFSSITFISFTQSHSTASIII